MDKRQVLWWAASLAILVFWGYFVYGVIDGKSVDDPSVWLVVAAAAIVTTSHWLNRPGAADTELEELTMEAKKARLRSEIASHQKD
jgi:hypothetical protein